MNIRSVSQSEINITLGDDACTIRTRSDTVSDFCTNNTNTALKEINCRPPYKPSGTTLALRVRIFFIDIQSHYMHLYRLEWEEI